MLALTKIAGMVPVLISSEIVAKVRRAYHRHIVSGVVVALTAEVRGRAPRWVAVKQLRCTWMSVWGCVVLVPWIRCVAHPRPPLVLLVSHTHTRAHMRTHVHTRAHTCTRTHRGTHTHTYKHTHPTSSPYTRHFHFAHSFPSRLLCVCHVADSGCTVDHRGC